MANKLVEKKNSKKITDFEFAHYHFIHVSHFCWETTVFAIKLDAIYNCRKKEFEEENNSTSLTNPTSRISLLSRQNPLEIEFFSTVFFNSCSYSLAVPAISAREFGNVSSSARRGTPVFFF